MKAASRDGALADFLGLPRDPPATLPQRVSAALSDAAVLRAAVARLDPVARAVVYELVSSGGQSEDTLVERLGLLRSAPASDVRDACALLKRYALAAHCSPGCQDLHPLSELEVLRTDALAFAARAVDPGPEPLPLAFRIALVAAYAAHVPPGLTKEGRIYAKWMRKAQTDLAHPSLPASMIEYAFGLLIEGGAFVPDDEMSTSLLHLDVEQAVRIVSHPSSDLALAVLRSNSWGPLAPGDVALAAIARVRAGRSVGACVSLLDIQDAASKLAALPWTVRHPRAAEFCDLPSIAFGVGSLRDLGLVECAYRDGTIEVARAPDETPPRERWSVLPNLEVLVPALTDPQEVVRIGCVARIGSVDRVTRFSLDRRSVQRATLLLEGADTHGVLDLLARGSAHEIPENVAANVASWLAGVRPATSFVGAVVVVQGAEQAAAVRRAEPAAHELAPGVYGVDTARLPKVLRALEKEGVVVAPTRRGDRASRVGAVVTRDLGAVIEEHRDALAKWASAPAAAARPEGRVSIEELQLVAPHVWRAVRDDPELLAYATTLSTKEREALRGKSNLAVRAALSWARAPADAAFVDAPVIDDALVAGVLGGDADAISAFVEWLGVDSVLADDDEDDDDEDGTGVWETLTLGQMRSRLRDAADDSLPIDILYADADGGHETHLVLPKVLTAQNHREVVRAIDLLDDGERERRFYLDRIVAVRNVEI